MSDEPASNEPKKRLKQIHEQNPSLRKLTLCGALITETTLISDGRVTCEKCRDESIERGVATYFKRHGLNRRFDLKGLMP